VSVLVVAVELVSETAPARKTVIGRATSPVAFCKVNHLLGAQSLKPDLGELGVLVMFAQAQSGRLP
jgi:hypothetical protein